ncbi:MAG TPA: acetylornithine transaminase [Abditibacteriaceae bacterium]|nr:acetylornithine transaminase [Abditibacteriaceae bacterium]
MSLTTAEKEPIAPAPAATIETPTTPQQQIAQPATATGDVAQTTDTSQQIEEQVAEHSRLHELIATDAEHGFQNYGRLPVAFVRGQGARLWDIDGKEYLDFLGGIAVVTLGHSHPEITRAIAEQAATLMHTANLYYIEPQVHLAEKLSQLSGGMRAFFCNSGAEANEAALKVVRKYFSSKNVDAQNVHATSDSTKNNAQSSTRFEIISTFDSFHGRTYGSLAATGQPKYHEGFAPMPQGFRYVPRNDFAAMKAAVSEQTAAILLEPIQGESGIWPCNVEYLQQVRALCDEHGLLLILDEVQAGIGRTGKFFAHQWSGIAPDIIVLAKGLGNGVPIGALLARDEVAKVLVPGTHGCTFGGNFLSCAAALATLRVLENENLMQNALDVGDYFQAQLQACEWICDVRGSGLMIGATTTAPIARELMKSSLNLGLVFNAIGDTYLRFLPPLTISRADVDEAMTKLLAAHQELN